MSGWKETDFSEKSPADKKIQASAFTAVAASVACHSHAAFTASFPVLWFIQFFLGDWTSKIVEQPEFHFFPLKTQS